ncbi:MAG: TolC family protein [Verrucomicrobiales bacterium]|nr:TolC family protein [Verrucomicrobiales bacterium]
MPDWWKQYNDPALNRDIACAFENSPDLQIIAARLEQADAKVKIAKTAAWPAFNLGYGFRFGRTKEVDFGPYNLAPWTGNANLKWELDIFHKLKRARESAEFNRRAVFWDHAAARLVLASRIAESRFRIYRLKKEIDVLEESTSANSDILVILRQREKAGLIAETEVHRMVAEDEKLKRTKEELNRLQLLAEVELETLKGGQNRECDISGSLPGLPPIPCRSFDSLVCYHPSLLAAESRLRAAYRIEESARLNLLPSFTLQGNLSGASPHFFLDQFKRWHREIGPVLDIPVFDPARRADLATKRGETNEAAAEFRAALIDVIGEIDSAYVNLASRDKQIKSVRREVEALRKARHFVTANFQSGIVSQVEVLESERSYLQTSRIKAALEEAVLQDHIMLIRALGGGLSECEALPVITAEPVIKPTPIESLLTVKHPGKKLLHR